MPLARGGSASVGGGPPPPPDYEGPLDIEAGAVFAYSQRRMAADFTDPVIQIDNGSTTQDFAADTDNAVDSTAITAFIGGGTGTLAKWYNQSGTEVTIENTGTAPHWSAAIVGDSPALGNVNTSSMYSTQEVSFPNGAATVFLVCKQNGGSDPIGTEMNFNTSNYMRFQAPQAGGASALQDIYNDDDGNEGFAQYDIVASSDAQLWDGAWDNTGHNMRLNGVAQTPTSVFDTPEPPGDITDLLILMFGDVGEYLVEIIAYDTILSDPTRDAIRQNIADFYGITL